MNEAKKCSGMLLLCWYWTDITKCWLFDKIEKWIVDNELLKYNINYWKLIRFFPIRGKAIEENDLGVTDEEFIEIRKNFQDRKQNFEIVINGETELKERHVIVLSSGRLVYSEDGEDKELDVELT